MSEIAKVEAIVSSKGQVTLPAAMRAKLGISAGSHIHFELRGNERADHHAHGAPNHRGEQKLTDDLVVEFDGYFLVGHGEKIYRLDAIQL